MGSLVHRLHQDCCRIKDRTSITSIRWQSTANFRPATRSNSYRVPHKLKRNLTNPHAILHPFAIAMQFVNVTAGVYRTRTDRRAVSFTDYVRIAPRLRIVPRFTTDATAAKNRDNGRGIAGQSQNPTRNGGNSRATPRSFRTPELHRKTCTQSYKSSRNPQSIRNSRHNR